MLTWWEAGVTWPGSYTRTRSFVMSIWAVCSVRMVTVGIDLGTSNSCVAVWERKGDGRPVVLKNADGQSLTPSCVALMTPKPIIGEDARQMAQAVFDSKRLMGADLSDDNVTMRAFGGVVKIDSLGYEGVIDARTCHFLPEEIAALILRRIREDVAAALKTTDFAGLGTSDQAIITVPAYFTDQARQATKTAGELAGWKVLRVVNEPTAAALAFVYMTAKDMINQIFVVFDLGGGTFDVSVVRVDEGDVEVLATDGDCRLGGTDFTDALVHHLQEKMGRELTVAESEQLRQDSERAKRTLSRLEQTTLWLGGKQVTVTRAEFEKLIEGDLERCEVCVKSVLEKAEHKLDGDDLKVSKVLLVGGSTRIPAVRKLIEKLFGMEPDTSLNADEAVALGAAVLGAVRDAVPHARIDNIVLSDVTPMALGVEVYEKRHLELIVANERIPVKEVKYDKLTTSRDNQEKLLIALLQGNSSRSEECSTLGKFLLGPLPPSPQGVLRFEVGIKVEDDGLVEVHASMIGGDLTGQMEVRGDRGLPEDFIRSATERVEAYFHGNMSAAQAELYLLPAKKRHSYFDEP